MGETSSEALIGRIAAGRQDALGEFYDRYASLVNGLALRILRDPSDAEDVVQEVFVQAWRQADRFDPARGTPEAWLCTLARTRALDKLRRRVSRREAPAEAAPGTTATPRNVEVLAVRKALEELSANQRKALELAYYEGLTQSEIAERLGEPLGTIKTRIRTAMMRLREALGPLPPASSEPKDSAKTETG
jgi:RNA polymerase sigma-70 factor (ECF subfamily)